jgi:NADH:ubiquinone oxidoreductase subunit 6 (subunit J)
LETILFTLFAFITAFCAMMVLMTPKLMYKAYFLLFSLVGIAGIFVLARADFLAAAQLMMYAGGILILIIFSLLFTGNTHTEIKKTSFAQIKILGITILATAMLVYILQQANFSEIHSSMTAQNFTTIKIIGAELLTTYLIPLELMGIFLLVILVGVALLNSNKPL